MSFSQSGFFFVDREEWTGKSYGVPTIHYSLSTGHWPLLSRRKRNFYPAYSPHILSTGVSECRMRRRRAHRRAGTA